MQKSLLNSKVISSDEDINNILRLAEAAGVTLSSLALLQSAKADYNRAIEMGDDAAAQRAEQRVLRASEQLKQDVAKLKPHVNVNTGNTSASNNVKSAGTAGKEDTDPHVTAFERTSTKSSKTSATATKSVKSNTLMLSGLCMKDITKGK